MRIFVSGMKRGIIIVAYWLAAIIFTACILMSLDYDIGHAAIMSLSFLPAAMALSFFLPKVEKTQEKKERVLGAVLALLAYGHFHLLKWLDKKYPTDGPITFYSVYKKISLKREDILYIESRDSEVWIYTQDGQQYRNRTGISQWEDVLGSGFVRIHRSYLVNRTYASVSSPECVCVAGKELPVSRKYKDEVFRMRRSIY